MSDFDAAKDVSNSILGRQAFARFLGNPKVFGAAFLPPERADWRGDQYTLGKALATGCTVERTPARARSFRSEAGSVRSVQAVR